MSLWKPDTPLAFVPTPTWSKLVRSSNRDASTLLRNGYDNIWPENAHPASFCSSEVATSSSSSTSSSAPLLPVELVPVVPLRSSMTCQRLACMVGLRIRSGYSEMFVAGHVPGQPVGLVGCHRSPRENSLGVAHRQRRGWIAQGQVG